MPLRTKKRQITQFDSFYDQFIFNFIENFTKKRPQKIFL